MSLCSLKRVKNGNVFPAFFHAAFHRAWITLCVFQAGTITELYRGGSRIFFRRGCTRLLLDFNTNKPHSFFFFEEYQLYSKTAGHVRGGHPLHPPLDPPLLYHDGDTFFNQLGGRRLTTTVV